MKTIGTSLTTTRFGTNTAIRGVFAALWLALMVSSATAGVCEYIALKPAKVGVGAAGATAAAGLTLKAVGVSAVAHSSGMAIATTASSGYVAGTLGAIGTTVGILTAPATLIVGGVIVAAAGSTVAYCHFSQSDKKGPHKLPTP